MARIALLHTLSIVFLMASQNMVTAEKMEFTSEVGPSGTQCFLESIAETMQGRSHNKQTPSLNRNTLLIYLIFFSL